MKDVEGFLNQVRETDKHIKLLYQRKDALRLCLYPSAICYDGDKVQTSPSDKVPDIMAEIAEYDDQIKRLQEMRIDQVKILEKELCKLDDVNQMTALTGYYAACKDMTHIANEMNYSKSTVYRLICSGKKKMKQMKQMKQMKREKCDII